MHSAVIKSRVTGRPVPAGPRAWRGAARGGCAGGGPAAAPPVRPLLLADERGRYGGDAAERGGPAPLRKGCGGRAPPPRSAGSPLGGSAAALRGGRV